MPLQLFPKVMMTAMQPNRVREPGVSGNLHVRTLTERSVSDGRFHHRDGPDSRGRLGRLRRGDAGFYVILVPIPMLVFGVTPPPVWVKISAVFDIAEAGLPSWFCELTD